MWKTKGSLWTVLAGLVIALVILFYLTGYRSYIVMSGSMEPQIPTGSLCLVNTRISYEEIREGDVIVFRQGNGLVTHRVIRITGEGMETKGDANELSDGIRVTGENFGGKTVGALPYLGYLLFWLKQPLVQGIGGALWILLWSRDRKDRCSNEEK